jgi:hypothetical protein
MVGFLVGCSVDEGERLLIKNAMDKLGAKLANNEKVNAVLVPGLLLSKLYKNVDNKESKISLEDHQAIRLCLTDLGLSCLWQYDVLTA